MCSSDSIIRREGGREEGREGRRGVIVKRQVMHSWFAFVHKKILCLSVCLGVCACGVCVECVCVCVVCLVVCVCERKCFLDLIGSSSLCERKEKQRTNR